MHGSYAANKHHATSPDVPKSETAAHQGLARDPTAIDRAICIACVRPTAFNVVKFVGDPPKCVSLLAYEEFDANPFPALLESWTIDFRAERSTHRSYRSSRNPPILHRKELLLAPDDPRREVFAQLTEELECLGLFDKANIIGFRKQWEKRLAKAGVVIRDHRVVADSVEADTDSGTPPSVVRHRTALSRSALSVPMQALARYGLLDGGSAVFDYGCGRGDDIAVLSSAGIQARGWDPHFSPGASLESSDVVNLGYVLNVIEEPIERIDALRTAYGLTQCVLAVAVMISGKADTSRVRPYRDGFLTARGTFQKYFTQEEARELIQRVVGQEAIPVGPGLFFVFRDRIAEQRLLEGHRHRQRDISHLLAIAPPPNTSTSHDQALLEENRELIEATWKRALGLGRLPYLDELDESIRQELSERIGSVRIAIQLAQSLYNAETLTQARHARIDDLTVYFALNCFSRRSRYRELPATLQRDVKAFFGSYRKADQIGRQLLFSLGDEEVILRSAQEASLHGVGYLNGTHSIQLDARLIDRLPATLRTFIGCTEQIDGDVGQADMVKIHMRSRKLTVLHYDNYRKTPLPRLKERIKVDLREQDIHFVEYGAGRPSQPLYQTSLHRPRWPDRVGQPKFLRFIEF